MSAADTTPQLQVQRRWIGPSGREEYRITGPRDVVLAEVARLSDRMQRGSPVHRIVADSTDERTTAYIRVWRQA